MRALCHRRRDQRPVRVAHVEIVEDRQALRQLMAVDLEHRYQSERVGRPIFELILRPLTQVDLAAFIVDALELEGDADAVSGGRAPIFVEDGPRHVGSTTLAKGRALSLPGARGSAGPTLCR